MSVKLLEEINPDDLALLYFLGCIPGGAKEYQLKKMWKDKIEKSLENLEQLTFLEVGVEKYMLTPYMISYVNQTIEMDSKSKYMKIICNFYKEILFDSYLKIGLGKREPTSPDS